MGYGYKNSRFNLLISKSSNLQINSSTIQQFNKSTFFIHQRYRDFELGIGAVDENVLMA